MFLGAELLFPYSHNLMIYHHFTIMFSLCMDQILNHIMCLLTIPRVNYVLNVSICLNFKNLFWLSLYSFYCCFKYTLCIPMNSKVLWFVVVRAFQIIRIAKQILNMWCRCTERGHSPLLWGHIFWSTNIKQSIMLYFCFLCLETIWTYNKCEYLYILFFINVQKKRIYNSTNIFQVMLVLGLV